MGRELKRVAMDFEWPMSKVWQRFINPFYDECRKCETCDGTGYGRYARHLRNLWWGYAPFSPEDNGSIPFTIDTPHVRAFAERQCTRNPEYYGYGEIAIQREARRICKLWNSYWSHHLNDQDIQDLVAADSIPWEFTRTPRIPDQVGPDFQLPNGWLKESNGYIPTLEEMNICQCTGIGRVGEYSLIKARCARKGVEYKCSECHGEGTVWSSPEAKQQAEDWKDVQPPEGKGYQMWETVSEGSPISPVFSTAEDLAAWLSNDPRSSEDGTYTQWLAMILGSGWSVSAVFSPDKGMQSGVAAMGDLELSRENT